MPTLFIMSGLPFSGKSTLSKQIANILNIKRVSFDEVWIQSENINNFIPTWENISQKCEDLIINELRNNRSIIYDNLGDNLTNRDKMKSLAKMVYADFKIIYVNVSREEVIKRRADNLISNTRSQVSDQNFNNALASFDSPSPSESSIIYTPGQDVEEWIKRNLS